MPARGDSKPAFKLANTSTRLPLSIDKLPITWATAPTAAIAVGPATLLGPIAATLNAALKTANEARANQIDDYEKSIDRLRLQKSKMLRHIGNLHRYRRKLRRAMRQLKR